MGDTFYMTPQGFPLGFDAGRHPAVGPDSARFVHPDCHPTIYTYVTINTSFYRLFAP